MTYLVQDALLAHLPHGTRPTPSSEGVKYKINCVACRARGHIRGDKTQRGAIFINNDGSAGYECFNCGMRTRQQPFASLTKRMEELLGYLGMSSDDVRDLKDAIWRYRQLIERGPLPPVTVAPKPMPTGAKPLGDWLDNPVPDVNLADVLDDLDGMSADRIKGLYWTPDPGPSGDMNRRFIEVYGDPEEPVGWSAVAIDETDDPPLFSDDNILHYIAEQEQKLEEEADK